MKLYLVCHGETRWSLTGQQTSRTDLGLTRNGERRAFRLYSLLHGLAFTEVLTSPLQRARRTCELAGLAAGARVVPDIREWEYGDYEGRTMADVQALTPGWNLFEHGCPQGESVDQVAQRAAGVLDGLRHKEGTAVLFSHGQFLRVLAVLWIGLPVKEAQHLVLDTATISILGHENPGGENAVISRWNAEPSAPTIVRDGPGSGQSLGPSAVPVINGVEP